MQPLDGERGQPVQIGAILLFAVLILLFTLFQATVVPQQNTEVEFNHNQQVHGQLQELRTGVLRTGVSGNSYPVTVALGVRYPDRALLQNPGPASGTLRTVPLRNVSLHYVEALDDEAADYWTGQGPGMNRTYATAALEYQPTYNYYTDAPTSRIESTVVFNRFAGETNLTLTGQSFIDGRTLTFVTVGGEYQESRTGTVTVDPRPISAASRTIAIQNRTKNRDLVVSVPTTLPNGTVGEAGTVGELLEAQFDPNAASGNDQYVRGYECSNPAGPGGPCGLLTVHLEAGVTYNLRLAHVGVGTGADTAPPAYIVDVEGDGTAIPEGGQQRVVAEVRDRFNNPVSGVTVSAELANTGNAPNPTLDRTTATTDEEGRAVFIFEAPDDVTQGGQNDKSVTYTVEVFFDDTSCNNVGTVNCAGADITVSEVDGQ